MMMVMRRRSFSLLLLLVSLYFTPQPSAGRLSWLLLLQIGDAWWVASCSSRLEPPPCDTLVAFSSKIFASRGTDSIHRHSLSPWRWRSVSMVV